MTTRAQVRASVEVAAKLVGYEKLWDLTGAIITGREISVGDEVIVEARDNRANEDRSTTKFGRKKSVLLRDTGDDPPSRGTTRYGRKAGILVDNEDG